MSYAEIVQWSQMIAMGLFGSLLAGIVFYAFRPSNAEKFRQAARLPLLIDEEMPAIRDDDEGNRAQ
ncbi:MAG: cbb3-type cytochrome c oxidase subunit 3 [Hyphomicrobium sp.]|jgi:cbb3-type cytochrome oxidase subunit 3|uniref:cbb3-type cytochrome c oxidase subunit 3 n=1 Tax=Hyphomicrobium sp. TaxID=82 RepID=UPI0025BF5A73|nr:cbb3-type cytochrome c oxidase subunit 3 [Hyphomicrobium sp.]MBX9861670.1 cbb3-type cytochrome c oxidase subunit 3 [Hyphomicrobium sp.]